MGADFLLGRFRVRERGYPMRAMASRAVHRHAGVRLHLQHGLSQLLRLDRPGVFLPGVCVAGKGMGLAARCCVASARFVGASGWTFVAGRDTRLHDIVEESGASLAPLASGSCSGGILRCALVSGESRAVPDGLGARTVLQIQWGRSTYSLRRSLRNSFLGGAAVGDRLFWRGDFSSPEREWILEEHSAGWRAVFGRVLRDGAFAREFSYFFVCGLDWLACLAAHNDFRYLRLVRVGLSEASLVASDRLCGLRRNLFRVSVSGHGRPQSNGVAGGRIIERASAGHEGHRDDFRTARIADGIYRAYRGSRLHRAMLQLCELRALLAPVPHSGEAGKSGCRCN